MTVYDLNRDQLQELKQHYYFEKTGEDLSYEELAFIDDYVSDEEIYREYAATDFTIDDFFGSAEINRRDGLSQEIGQAIQILANLHRYSIIFSNPGMSSTEAIVKHGVTNALKELNKAYDAALALGY